MLSKKPAGYQAPGSNSVILMVLVGLTFPPLSAKANTPNPWSASIASCLAEIPEDTEDQANPIFMTAMVSACQTCCTTNAKAQQVDALQLWSCLMSCCTEIQQPAPISTPPGTPVAPNRETCCLDLLYVNGDTKSPTPLSQALAQSALSTLLQSCQGT